MIELFARPEAWAALAALITMEVVLGIDNLIFISILTNKLPAEQRPMARGIGIGLALGLRLILLASIAWFVQLTTPVIDLGITGQIDDYGAPTFETAFSWRDLILIAGGIFLVWKSVTEIHHHVDPKPAHTIFPTKEKPVSTTGAILQIVLLDIVFSVDSILTAVGMTDHLPIMLIAVIVAVSVMFFAAGPVARFISNNPTVVMLALAFLLIIGMVLIADGFGRHVPKGYIYAAMAFAIFVEFLNMSARKRNAVPTNA